MKLETPVLHMLPVVTLDGDPVGVGDGIPVWKVSAQWHEGLLPLCKSGLETDWEPEHLADSGLQRGEVLGQGP